MSDNEFRERFDECQTVREVLSQHGRIWMDSEPLAMAVRLRATDAAELRIGQLQHNDAPLVDAEVSDAEWSDAEVSTGGPVELDDRALDKLSAACGYFGMMNRKLAEAGMASAWPLVIQRRNNIGGTELIGVCHYDPDAPNQTLRIGGNQ